MEIRFEPVDDDDGGGGGDNAGDRSGSCRC